MAEEEPEKEEKAKVPPGEEEKKGERVGEHPSSQAEELLSEPILIPRNPMALVGRMVMVVFALDVAAAVVILLLAFLSALGGILFVLAALFLLIKTAALAFVMIRSAIVWSRHSYYLTETKLIKKKGVTANDEEVYELEHIRHVRLFQDSIGRLLDYGNVELLITAAGLKEKVRLSDLKNPDHFKSVFTNYIGDPQA